MNESPPWLDEDVKLTRFKKENILGSIIKLKEWTALINNELDLIKVDILSNDEMNWGRRTLMFVCKICNELIPAKKREIDVWVCDKCECKENLSTISVDKPEEKF